MIGKIHTQAVVTCSTMKNSYLFSLCLIQRLLVLCFMPSYSHHGDHVSAIGKRVDLSGLFAWWKCVFSQVKYVNCMTIALQETNSFLPNVLVGSSFTHFRLASFFLCMDNCNLLILMCDIMLCVCDSLFKPFYFSILLQTPVPF